MVSDGTQATEVDVVRRIRLRQDSPARLADEAADEIERLRTENASLKEQLESATSIAVARGKELIKHGLA